MGALTGGAGSDAYREVFAALLQLPFVSRTVVGADLGVRKEGRELFAFDDVSKAAHTGSVTTAAAGDVFRQTARLTCNCP
jgi:hypothetical protein